ncbi:MAG TPA: ATP-binding cassette domain-containing protein [Clostridia bacterium]
MRFHPGFICALRNIGIIPQDTFLFNMSVKDNILMGRNNITPEQILKAAQLAGAHDFIIQLQDGYNTLVGEKGCLLSGGQKKRISIARALLENPYILIMDEATADLDEISEKSILDSIQSLSRDRIVFMVTHKPSNLVCANKIISFQHGKVSCYRGLEEYREQVVCKV